MAKKTVKSEPITTADDKADEVVVASIVAEIALPAALQELIDLKKTGGLGNRDRAIKVLTDVVLGMAGVVDGDDTTPTDETPA